MCNALFSVIDIQPHILFWSFLGPLAISFLWRRIGLDLCLFGIFFDDLTWFGKIGTIKLNYQRASALDCPLAIPTETSAWKLEGEAYA